MFAEFISTYGTTILYTLLSAAATAIGAWIGRVYKEKVNDETKRKVVKTCCKAVKQLYADLNGAEKYDRAVAFIVDMLGEKGITITELEIKMLIEEVCSDFVDAAKEEIMSDKIPPDPLSVTEQVVIAE